jgi:hypothetical protein
MCLLDYRTPRSSHVSYRRVLIGLNAGSILDPLCEAVLEWACG